MFSQPGHRKSELRLLEETVGEKSWREKEKKGEKEEVAFGICQGIE